MSLSLNSRALSIGAFLVMSIGYVSMCNPAEYPETEYDRVGIPLQAEKAEQPSRRALDRPTSASVSAVSERDKRLDARKTELARRMFWIMLSLR